MRFREELRSWAIVIVVVLILRAVFVQAYVIPTGSMEKTLLVGDALLVNRFVYGVNIPYTQIPLIPGRMPRRGEIVVFKYEFENRDFVKRCVAVAGDTVAVINKVLYINHHAAVEPYVYHGDARILPRFDVRDPLYQEKWEKARLVDDYGPAALRDNFGPVVVPQGCIFVMGDNRDNSYDSRFWGPLNRKLVKGKPLFIYFSFQLGREASSIFDILRFWEWKSIRFGRVGRVI